MPPKPFPARGTSPLGILRFHRWVGIGVAALTLTLAVTGVLISFRFEIEDAMLSSERRPTDFSAIEMRMEELTGGGTAARINWIWTTAGLPDRYVIDYTALNGIRQKAYIDGEGKVLRNRAADDPTLLGLMLQLHQNLLTGEFGHWLLALTGAFLCINLILGFVLAYPRDGRWGRVLKLARKNSGGTARLFSWHRAVGLWGVLPAILVIGAGTMILFEDQIREVLDAPKILLPANPLLGHSVGLASVVLAAEEAIPGSRFVGTTFPTSSDASYYAWVRAPGSLYREGYGGSLVVVDANDASIRGAFPLPGADARYAFVGSFYPVHTGEWAGFWGRLLTLFAGVWLAVIAVTGILLWWRRRARPRNN